MDSPRQSPLPDDEPPVVLLTYGWSCITCGAAHGGMDEDDAEAQRDNHDCDTYWNDKDD